MIKENFTGFHTRRENFISQNKTEETHVISKYFRDLLDQPVKHSFNRFRSVVKDVSQSLGKQIQFKLSGDQCSLNKEDLNLLHDAMIHLVRNSLDHGIEKPEVREKNNKDKEGTLEINCLSIDDDRLKITLQDDGGGINPDIITEKILQKGLKTNEDLLKMTKDEKLNLIFLPGFSTKEEATELSGRGVGMDVVKENLKTIGAQLKVESEINKGPKFIIQIDKTNS